MRFRVNSTNGLMGVVASAAVTFATYLALLREEGSPLLGSVIIVGCIAGVAWIRTTEVITKHRMDGESVTTRWLWTAIIASFGVSTLIVGLADVAFLLAYGLVAGGQRFFLFSVDRRPQYITPAGLLAGIIMGLAVCYLSRRAFWRSALARRRLFRPLAPMAVVLLLLVANLMWERTWYRLDQAQNHDTWVGIYGGESTLPSPPPRTADFRPRAEMIEYHERMRRKWEYAAVRPWLSVDPDPPPPKQ